MNQIGLRYLMIINVNIKPLALIQHFLLLLSHSVVSDSSVTPWTAIRQAPLFMGFSGKYTGVSCHFLLQGTFLIQDWQTGLLHWQMDSLPLSHQGIIIQHSVQFSRSVVYDSLPPHGLQHARLPCPSPTPVACSNSCTSNQ